MKRERKAIQIFVKLAYLLKAGKGNAGRGDFFDVLRYGKLEVCVTWFLVRGYGCAAIHFNIESKGIYWRMKNQLREYIHGFNIKSISNGCTGFEIPFLIPSHYHNQI